MALPENMGDGIPPPTPSSSLGPGGATQNSLKRPRGRGSREQGLHKACSDLTAASLFPRKPQESFFEFLLILATPAPPPGTGLGGARF